MWCVTRHTSIVPSSGPVNRRRVWETGDTTLTERWLTGSRSAPPQAWAMAGTLWQEFRALRLPVGVELVFTHTCWQRAPSSHEVHTNISEEAQTHTNMSTIKWMARTRNEVRNTGVTWPTGSYCSFMCCHDDETRQRQNESHDGLLLGACFNISVPDDFIFASLFFLSSSVTHCLKSLRQRQSDELIPDEDLTFDRLTKCCCWQADKKDVVLNVFLYLRLFFLLVSFVFLMFEIKSFKCTICCHLLQVFN